MQISFRSRHLVLTDELRSASSDKIAHLERLLAGMEQAEVVFSEEQHKRTAEREVCEVTMRGHGHYVRARAGAVSPTAALDLVIDKLEHQLHKLKGKIDGRHHGGPKRGKHHHPGIHVPPQGGAKGAAATALAGVGVLDRFDPDAAVSANGVGHANGNGHAPVADANEAHIVKEKRFSMTRLTVDDAALQMDLLQHDFYLFVNDETGQAAVLYRRDDGHLGLIDTE